MTHQEFKALLDESLADVTLTRTERGKLRAALNTLKPDPREQDLFRSYAFETARQQLQRHPESATAIVDWLEGVVRSLHVAAETPEDVCEAWFSPGDNCPARIRSLLADARKSADLCVFTITDDRLASAILDAHHRGVAVRIITDNDKSMDLGSDADRLREAGIDLRLDRSPFHMHHKFAIFDGASLLNGSYNWTRGAAEDNEENFIVCSDSRLIRSFLGVFEALWARLDR